MTGNEANCSGHSPDATRFDKVRPLQNSQSIVAAVGRPPYFLTKSCMRLSAEKPLRQIRRGLKVENCKNLRAICHAGTNSGSVLIYEFFGARIVLNPQCVDSHHDDETNFTRPVLVPCCELRQLALRNLRRYPLDGKPVIPDST